MMSNTNKNEAILMRLINQIAFFILLVDQVISDKYQVVFRGPCLKQSESFCNNKVRNSYCSKQNNECFCLPDFVTVRERTGVKCKPLLSEIKCRFDTECSEITNSSICHPGAGLCTCPSGTVFIPQLNSCKNYLGNSTNDICFRCSRLGGTCFAEDIINKSQQYFQDFNTLCSCPFNTDTPKGLRKMISDYYKFQLCTAIQGEFCNGVDILCVSKNSKCIYSKEYYSTICQCENGYAAVFERKIGKFNCYKIVFDVEYPQCSHCFTVGGQCILIANSSTNVVLKCLCNKYQYFDIFSYSFECHKVTANIRCQSLKIEICLNIPNDYEYHKKLLDTIRRTPDSITVTDSYFNGKKNKICKMNDYKISHEKGYAQLCSEFEANTKSHDVCRISSGNYLSNNFYGLYVRIWNLPYIIDLANDFLFDLTCKTNIEQEEFLDGQIIDRTWIGSGKTIIPDVFLGLDSTIELSIGDPENVFKNTFMALQNIEIHCNMLKVKDDYPFFNVEQCSEIINNNHKIIYRKSIIKNHDSIQTIQFHRILNQSENTGINYRKLISSKFTAPNVSTLTNVVYSCIFKLCEDSPWCLQYENNNVENNLPLRKTSKYVSVKFLLKRVQIQVASLKVDQKFVTFKDDYHYCQKGSVCLNQNQLISLSILTGIFFILILIVLTILIVKRSMAQLTDSTNNAHIHQMNFMDISLLPLIDLYRNETDPLIQPNSVNISGVNSFGNIFNTSISNSMSLKNIERLEIDESNIHVIPQTNNTVTELIDNTFINSFHYQQSEISVGNQPISTLSYIKSKSKYSSFNKTNETIPLLYNYVEPDTYRIIQRTVESTFIDSNKCQCHTSSISSEV